MKKAIDVILALGIICLVFCIGSYVGQKTFEPQIITVTQEVPVPYETLVPVEVVKEIEVGVIKEVEVIKEVLIQPREFESVDELKRFLAEDDTDSHIILYPLESDGRIPLKGICDHYALQLQGRALEAGYLMSTEIINRTHMINCVVIGNNVYFIEPQTDKVWLWGYRQGFGKTEHLKEVVPLKNHNRILDAQ